MVEHLFMFSCKCCNYGLFILNDAVFALNNNNGQIVSYIIQKEKLKYTAFIRNVKVLCIRCYTEIGRYTSIQGHVLIHANSVVRVVKSN